MNNLKFGVLACGLVGLIACFIPDHGASFWTMRVAPAEMGGGFHVYIILAAYAAAAVMGALAVAKPPMLRWQSIVATLAFGLILLKFRALVVDALKHGNLSVRLMMISAILGVVVSILALAKPETAR
jgi:hypothetical protein